MINLNNDMLLSKMLWKNMFAVTFAPDSRYLHKDTHFNRGRRVERSTIVTYLPLFTLNKRLF